ncbi:hypothetical protein Mapa_013449 [Marchantia paleacea]|nr:hypothetical protein Mapa_013449 [Marchantia paleacea]
MKRENMEVLQVNLHHSSTWKTPSQTLESVEVTNKEGPTRPIDVIINYPVAIAQLIHQTVLSFRWHRRKSRRNYLVKGHPPVSDKTVFACGTAC